MRTLLVVFVLTVSLSVLVGCSSDSADPVGATDVNLAKAGDGVIDAPASITNGLVYRLSDGAVIGTSKLVRTDTGVSIKVTATDMAPGTYTLWWLPINAAENCATTPCDFPDLDNPAILWDAGFADGTVAGLGGRITLAGNLAEGDIDGFFFGLGMEDARAVEMHAIVRYHGPILVEDVNEQLHSFDGGCNPECVDVAGTNFVP